MCVHGLFEHLVFETSKQLCFHTGTVVHTESSLLAYSNGQCVLSLMALPAAPPTAAPVPASNVVLTKPSPAAPTDCSVATTPPAAVGAIADIIDAAHDPASMPPLPNPSHVTAAGTATGAKVPPTITPPAISPRVL